MGLNIHELALRVARRRRARRRTPVGLDELEPRLLLATDVLMYHDGPTSIGSNPSETRLTRSNVTPSTFGKLFQVQVDGQVYAQPLVATGVNITTGPSPGVHNVVFVATEHDSLYAIDASAPTGVVLWKRSFLTAGLPGATSIVPVPYADVKGSIAPEVGITGTPVIDKATNTLYVVAKTKETVGGVAHYVQRLYAVNLSNGTNKVAPFLIGNTTGTNTNHTPVYVYGSGDGSVTDPYNGTGKPVVQFNSLRENERTALTLVGGVVYAGWASPGDIFPYHGWVIGFDATTLAVKGVLNPTPNGGDGGVWESGGSVSTDGTSLYFQVGNGTFDGSNGATGNVTTAPGPVTGLDANGFPVKGDYGDSVVKVGLDSSTTPTDQNLNGWGLKVVDYFTPTNQYYLNANDLDLGSGAPMLLPRGVGSAAHPALLLGGSKAGTVYLIDRDHMGKFGTTDHVVQEVKGQFSGVYATAAYAGGRIDIVGPGGHAKAFSIANGAMSPAPVSQSSDTFAYNGSTPSLSSNGLLGGINGIVWDLDRGTNELRAYSSASYGTELYNSNQAPNGRDALGTIPTFGVPTVANGRVFVGTAGGNPNNDLVVYGIIAPPGAAPAAPTGLIATALGSSQIKLTWTDHGVAPNWADDYSVEESTDGVHFTPVKYLGAGTAAFTVTGLSPATTYDFRVRAINSRGDSGYTNVAVATTGSAAAFIKSDTTTKGNWVGKYGSQGYDLVGSAASLPAYARVTPSGAKAKVWAASTTDPRALQNPSGSGRRATVWYASPGYSVDLDLTDGQAHDVALYFYNQLANWAAGKTETVQVADAATGAVLDTRTLTAAQMNAGTYLRWKLSGHVVFKLTATAPQNALLSGLFFDPVPTAAALVKSDATRSGNWVGAYGGQGTEIAGYATGLPSHARVSLSSGATPFTFAASTTDPRAPQNPANPMGSRTAAGWSNATSFTVDVNLTDGQAHDLALYALDWGRRGRVEQVQVSDASSGAVLSTQALSSFGNGAYLVYTVTGHVKITFTTKAGPNAVLSGLFLGPA